VLEGFIITNGNAAGGAGVYCDTSSPTIQNCVIAKNSASLGGGLFCYNSSPLIWHVTFYGNDVSVSGGGMYLKSGSDPTVRNSILWNDSAPASPEIHLDGASVTVEYSDVDGGWPGTGNIDANPDFADTADDDYHIEYSSPCRDTGFYFAGNPKMDFEWDDRKAYGNPDMGADEFHQHLYVMGDVTPGGNVEVKFVGFPGSTPVGLFIGTGVLDMPVASKWGLWYLKFPVMGPIVLAPIPASGIEVLHAALPVTPAGPYMVPLQAMVGSDLTNLFMMEVN
jgi:hypothetical protein